MIYLRDSNIKDLNHVCNNMRVMDKIEAYYQTGHQPEDALRLTYLAGHKVLTIAKETDRPVGLCGVVDNGCIWFVATEELFSKKIDRIQLTRKGRIWVDSLLKKYPLLYNVVYAENKSAIKWLKALGFTFINYHAKYGQEKKPFYEFLRIA